MLQDLYNRKLTQRGPKFHIAIALLIFLVISGIMFFAYNKDSDTLNFYRQYGYYTNPGEHARLYKGLPESLPELCRLIKAQLIHPVDLPNYPDMIGIRQDGLYPTVSSMLAGLLEHNPAGLTYDRKPEQRLIVTCRYHAILLASILKERGIPVRVRYGFAHYLYPGYHVYHVICEVWNEKEQRWMLVDPDRQLVDFPREQFESAADAWLKYQKGEVDPSTYGVPGWVGARPILSVLCHDLAAVLGSEPVDNDYPPIVKDTEVYDTGKPNEKRETITKLAILLQDPDKNFRELKRFYDKHEFLQFYQRQSGS